MISDSLPDEDMARLIRTCRTMAHALNFLLYRRKVRQNDYFEAITCCAMTNSVGPLNTFFDAGAKVGTIQASRWAQSTSYTYGKNAGCITAHPLTVAAGLGHVETVTLLLNRAEEINDPGNFRHVFTQYFALMNAIQNGHTDIVRLLVDVGFDLHSYGVSNKSENTPLVFAATEGEFEMVQIMATAMRNDRQKYPTRTYRAQLKNAFLAAIKADSHQIAGFLLYEGLSPNYIRRGPSLLFHAVTSWPPSYSKSIMVEMLLLYGADTARTDPGLIQGCWINAFDSVRNVLVAGCAWKYRKREVKWAKTLATTAGRHDIVQLFDNYMNQRIAAGEVVAE
jgi:hypothetical protein